MKVAEGLNSNGLRALVACSLLAIVAWSVSPFSAGHLTEGYLILLLALIGAISFLRIRWAIAILIFLSPAHFLVKEIFPFEVANIWREAVLMLILGSWLLHASFRRFPVVRASSLGVSALLSAYLLWGVFVVFLSENLLIGISGFRFVMGLAPLYFVVSATLRNYADIRLYFGAFLASGVIVACIAVLQFALVSVLSVVDQGTGIDFARKYAPGSYAKAGIPWDRSNSILIGPNELGIFMALCFALCLGYYLTREHSEKRVHWSVPFMLLFSLGMLVSMSRSSMISLAIAFLLLGFVSRRATRFTLVLLVLGCLSVLAAPFYFIPLFEPIIRLADPYFTNTLVGVAGNAAPSITLLLGQGYGATLSTLEVLGMEGSSVLRLGSADIYFVQAAEQIGLLGVLLFLGIWLGFARGAYRSWRRAETSFARGTGFGLLAVLLVTLAATAHVAAWEYASFAGTYYMLGAIATRLPSARPGKVEGAPLA